MAEHFRRITHCTSEDSTILPVVDPGEGGNLIQDPYFGQNFRWGYRAASGTGH